MPSLGSNPPMLMPPMTTRASIISKTTRLRLLLHLAADRDLVLGNRNPLRASPVSKATKMLPTPTRLPSILVKVRPPRPGKAPTPSTPRTNTYHGYAVSAPRSSPPMMNPRKIPRILSMATFPRTQTSRHASATPRTHLAPPATRVQSASSPRTRNANSRKQRLQRRLNRNHQRFLPRDLALYRFQIQDLEISRIVARSLT